MRANPGAGIHEDERFEDFSGMHNGQRERPSGCLLYTSDAGDERSSVDLGGRRIIKKKTNIKMR